MIITLKDLYFDWLFKRVTDFNPQRKRFKKLLRYLFDRDFYWLLPLDENRYYDALNLREDFFDEIAEGGRPISIEEVEDNFGNQTCNLLEVMVALAIRCEIDIVGNSSYGTSEIWFWRMINNLGLYTMDDYDFDHEMTAKIIDIFLSRKYEPDGEGNIFYIRGDKRYMREVEIWCQMCWYVDYILNE